MGFTKISDLKIDFPKGLEGINQERNSVREDGNVLNSVCEQTGMLVNIILNKRLNKIKEMECLVRGKKGKCKSAHRNEKGECVVEFPEN